LLFRYSYSSFICCRHYATLGIYTQRLLLYCVLTASKLNTTPIGVGEPTVRFKALVVRTCVTCSVGVPTEPVASTPTKLSTKYVINGTPIEPVASTPVGTTATFGCAVPDAPVAETPLTFVTILG